MIGPVTSWEFGYETVQRADREPVWLVFDVPPIIGVVTGGNGWGSEPALAALLLDRCRQALTGPGPDALSRVMAAIETAVIERERPHDDDSTVAGATLLSLEEGRFSFAHVGAGALLHPARSGLRRLTAGHQLGYQVAAEEGMERAFEHPLRRIWSTGLDEDRQEWDTGSGTIAETDLLLVVTPDLAWELQLGMIELPPGRRTPRDLASEIVGRASAEGDSDNGATAIVARLRPGPPPASG